jgi:hypothetical protein
MTRSLEKEIEKCSIEIPKSLPLPMEILRRHQRMAPLAKRRQSPKYRLVFQIQNLQMVPAGQEFHERWGRDESVASNGFLAEEIERANEMWGAFQVSMGPQAPATRTASWKQRVAEGLAPRRRYHTVAPSLDPQVAATSNDPLDGEHMASTHHSILGFVGRDLVWNLVDWVYEFHGWVVDRMDRCSSTEEAHHESIAEDILLVDSSSLDDAWRHFLERIQERQCPLEKDEVHVGNDDTDVSWKNRRPSDQYPQWVERGRLVHHWDPKERDHLRLPQSRLPPLDCR